MVSGVHGRVPVDPPENFRELTFVDEEIDDVTEEEDLQRERDSMRRRAQHPNHQQNPVLPVSKSELHMDKMKKLQDIPPA